MGKRERAPQGKDRKMGKDGKEIKDYDSLIVEIRKEFKQNEQYMEKKYWRLWRL